MAAAGGVGTAGRNFGLQPMVDTLGSVAGPVTAGITLLVAGHAANRVLKIPG